MELAAGLRAFAAVARHESFTRAAQELFIDQSAVSKHVASLERRLGTVLATRGRKGVTLTPAGRVLADHVLRAEALLANAERAVEAVSGAAYGTLSLVSSGIPGTYLIPPTLARFRSVHPDVEIEFRVLTSGPAIEAVRAHEAEIGIVGGFEAPPELETEPVAEDEVVLVGPPSLGNRRLTRRDLEDLTWISREEGSATRAAVEAARWQAGLHAVRALELPSWESVKIAVAAGEGIAAISLFALELELAAGSLAVLDLPRWRLSRTIAVVTAREVPLTPPAQQFLELVRSEWSGPMLRPRRARRSRPSRTSTRRR